MIRINEDIRYQNVVTRKVYCHYKGMEEELTKFVNLIRDRGYKSVGPLTYALYNVPSDENILIEYIMPVANENISSDEELLFHSYYSVENMVATYVFSDYETEMEYAYASLIDFLKQSKLEIVTPIFHIVDNDKKYIEVKIGYQAV